MFSVLSSIYVLDEWNEPVALIYVGIPIVVCNLDVMSDYELGARYFIPVMALFVMFMIWVNICNYRQKKLDLLEIERHAQELLDKQNQIVNCNWSFEDDGIRYCCLNDDVVESSLNVCIANCKGFKKTN
ncbi:MAG: hypothetical protein ACRDDH_14680 [Cetobacterium sp.]